MLSRILDLFTRTASRRASRTLSDIRFCDSCSRVSSQFARAVDARQHVQLRLVIRN